MPPSRNEDRPDILVLDGNSHNAALLRRFLAKQGYDPTVMTELNTLDDQLLEAVQFDCAVIDIDRFDRPVWNCCGQLHDLGIPFIVLSGIRDRSLRRKSREHGAQTYVIKPIPQRELRSLISNILDFN